MRNFAVKIFIVTIIGFLAGAAAFYFWKSKYVLPVPPEEKTGAKTARDTGAEDSIAKIAQNNQAEIIDYVEKNIDKLSGEKPVSGQKWSAIRIWFIDDKNFYADYKDSAYNLRRILVFRPVGGRGAIYEVLGYFVPSDNGWILKSGKDLTSASPSRLYEKNEQTGEWIIK